MAAHVSVRSLLSEFKQLEVGGNGVVMVQSTRELVQVQQQARARVRAVTVAGILLDAMCAGVWVARELRERAYRQQRWDVGACHGRHIALLHL